MFANMTSQGMLHSAGWRHAGEIVIAAQKQCFCSICTLRIYRAIIISQLSEVHADTGTYFLPEMVKALGTNSAEGFGVNVLVGLH